MKMNELRKKDASELIKTMAELRKKMADIRFRFAANQLKNTSETGSIRKEIARISTILRENKN